jgi:hypothetical protein
MEQTIKERIESLKRLDELELSGISQMYLGGDNVCRCGCAGEYYPTSFFSRGDGSYVCDDKVEEKLAEVKKDIIEGNAVSIFASDTYINISYGRHMHDGDDVGYAVTFYTDDLKESNN